MVFIFRTGIIHLDRRVMDERLLPGRDVQLEESVQGVVDRTANEVATCYFPSREQTHNNVRYPTIYRNLLCFPRPPHSNFMIGPEAGRMFLDRKNQVPLSRQDSSRVIKMEVEGAKHPQWPSSFRFLLKCCSYILSNIAGLISNESLLLVERALW